MEVCSLSHWFLGMLKQTETSCCACPSEQRYSILTKYHATGAPNRTHPSTRLSSIISRMEPSVIKGWAEEIDKSHTLGPGHQVPQQRCQRQSCGKGTCGPEKMEAAKKTHAIHFQSKPQFIFGHLIGLPSVVQHARILFINPFVSRLHHLDDWMLQNLLHHQVASAHWKNKNRTNYITVETSLAANKNLAFVW